MRRGMLCVAVCFILLLPQRSSHAELVVHYIFNGNVQDVSGNANHGAISGSPAFVDGETDGALLFNNPEGGAGATQWVSIPNAPSILTLEDESFTFAIKYKSTDSFVPNQANGRLFGNFPVGGSGLTYDYNDDDTAGAYAHLNGTTGPFVIFEQDARDNPLSVTTDGNWHWGILTYDRASGRIDFYADTNIIGSRTSVDLGLIPFSNLSIGRVANSPGFAARFTTVDEFRLYNRALTSDEVEGLVQAVPEPSSLLSAALGLAGLGGYAIRH